MAEWSLGENLLAEVFLFQRGLKGWMSFERRWAEMIHPLQKQIGMLVAYMHSIAECLTRNRKILLAFS
jgi:hypothetical protein